VVQGQRTMFGSTIAEMERDLLPQAERMGSWRMLAMSILSDAQEAASYGAINMTRQCINKAKWILGAKCADRS
jgi:hypothetical protein